MAEKFMCAAGVPHYNFDDWKLSEDKIEINSNFISINNYK